jgi:hypothetical protein
MGSQLRRPSNTEAVLRRLRPAQNASDALVLEPCLPGRDHFHQPLRYSRPVLGRQRFHELTPPNPTLTGKRPATQKLRQEWCRRRSGHRRSGRHRLPGSIIVSWTSISHSKHRSKLLQRQGGARPAAAARRPGVLARQQRSPPGSCRLCPEHGFPTDPGLQNLATSCG